MWRGKDNVLVKEDDGFCKFKKFMKLFLKFIDLG
jgi:hypothetical protein